MERRSQGIGRRCPGFRSSAGPGAADSDRALGRSAPRCRFRDPDRHRYAACPTPAGGQTQGTAGESPLRVGLCALRVGGLAPSSPGAAAERTPRGFGTSGLTGRTVPARESLTWASRRTLDSASLPRNAALVSGISRNDSATPSRLRHTAAGSPDKATSQAVVEPNPWRAGRPRSVCLGDQLRPAGLQPGRLPLHPAQLVDQAPVGQSLRSRQARRLHQRYRIRRHPTYVSARCDTNPSPSRAAKAIGSCVARSPQSTPLSGAALRDDHEPPVRQQADFRPAQPVPCRVAERIDHSVGSI